MTQEAGKSKEPDFEMYEIVTANFRQAMIKELAANHDKGDRELPQGWLSMKTKQFLGELWYHTGKLQEAIRGENIDLIKEYSADIANCALMIYDKYSPLLPAPPKQ